MTMETVQATTGDSSLLDELSVAVLLINNEGIIVYVNTQVCSDLGKSMEQIVGMHYQEVFTPGFIGVYKRVLFDRINNRKYSGIYFWAERSIWEQISASEVKWKSMSCIMLTIANVNEIAHADFQLETATYYDNTLKLPNGARLEEDIDLYTSSENILLLYLEIRNFQDINELYGWNKGGNLLKQVRDWLLISESRIAQLYRVNDGFAILGRKVTMDDARSRCREIQQQFKKPWEVPAGGKNLFVYLSVNIGIVYGKYIKNEMRNILMRTMRAPKQDKEGFAVYDEEEDKRIKTSIATRDSLISCMFNDMKGFEVHYQPIVDTTSRRWVAVEALCRWKTPNGEWVSPADFIPMAEQLNLIDQLDSWVRNTAMRQCVSLGLGQLEFTLEVNFSPMQRLDSESVEALLQDVVASGFPIEKLNIEITESTKMVFDKERICGLARLKESGIRLGLDDFGTGYSSIENLMKISVTFIKTEKMFMDGIENDPSRQYLLKMMVDLAHHHDLYLIAEGVESEEEFALARQYGVDLVQGYLFSKPLPFELLQKEMWRFQRWMPVSNSSVKT